MRNKRKTKQEKCTIFDCGDTRNYELGNKNYSAGITLIALVVTIVVLLILAGVTLNLVIGNNGLIFKAKDAKQKTDSAALDERVKLAITDAQTEGMGKILSTESLDNSLKIYVGEDNYNLEEDGTEGWIITTRDKTYNVSSDGDITITDENNPIIKNKITVTLNPERNTTPSITQEVTINIESELPVTSEEVQAMWSKENIEKEGDLPSNFSTLAETISVTQEGNTLKGTAYKAGASESGNYYLYVKAIINGETIIKKGGEYKLQRAPTTADLTITPTETTDTYVKLKIEATEIFEGYELQYKTDSTDWAKYTEEINVTENTTVYGRLYNESTGKSIDKTFVVDTIICLHENMAYSDSNSHYCVDCGYTEEHTFAEQVNYYGSCHRCTVCGYEENHTWSGYIGSSEHICELCGKIENHIWSDYGENCTICGVSHLHNWVNSEYDLEHHYCEICSVSEEHEWEATTDEFGNVTEMSMHVCTKCRTEEDHMWVSSIDGYSYNDINHICAKCRLEAEHEWREPSNSTVPPEIGDVPANSHYCAYCEVCESHAFDENGYCYICNFQCSHGSWDQFTYRCNVCGKICNHEEYIEMNSEQHYCVNCGASEEHNYMDNGDGTHSCALCGRYDSHASTDGDNICDYCGATMDESNYGF